MYNNLIILAGGMSSRMKKPDENAHLTPEEETQANSRSKALIGIGEEGRPLLDYLLYNSKKAGYKNIYILISEKPNNFKDFYGLKPQGNDFNGLNISYAVQYLNGREKPYGTADALYQVVEQYPHLNDGYYTVCNSDNLYSLEALKALREEAHPNAFIAYDRDSMDFPPERVMAFALSKLDENDFLTDILEKPPLEEIEKYRDRGGKLRVSMNAFKFQGRMFLEFLKNCPPHPLRDEKELPTALLNMVKAHPGSVKGIPFAEHVPDLTSKSDIHDVRDYLRKAYPHLSW